ncbi:PE-PPE domain-containing protein [Mycolicibacterium sp. CBM1]
MNRAFVTAVITGLVCSTTFLGEGYASAETALIVPGTQPPPEGNPARKLYHFDPDMKPQIGANYYDSAEATKLVVPYPGSLWPITGRDTPRLGPSVDAGTDNLDGAIRESDGQPVVVSGLSQGTLVLDAEQARLANDPNAPAPDQLTFVKAGDPSALFQKYFKPGTYLPFLDYTVPYPVESQYDTKNVVAQYDIFADPPDRPGNVLALANAVVAGGRGHTASAFSNPEQVAPQNVSVSTNDRGATTTTYFIPANELPLTGILREVGVPDGIADDADKVMRPMVDKAYGPAPDKKQGPVVDVSKLRTQLQALWPPK